MDRLVDHLFVFEGDGVIKDFPGNYSQYRLWNEEQEQLAVAGYLLPEAVTTVNHKPVTGNSKKRLSYKDKREFELLEQEIAGLTKEKDMINKKFNEGSNLSFEELQQLSQRIGEISTLIDMKELRWLELSEISEI